MINKNDILTAVNALTHQTSGRQNKRLIHPVREWLFGMLIAFCLLIAGGVYTFYLYQTYSSLEVIANDSIEKTPSLRSEIITSVLEEQAVRVANFESLKIASPVTNGRESAAASAGTASEDLPSQTPKSVSESALNTTASDSANDNPELMSQ